MPSHMFVKVTFFTCARDGRTKPPHLDIEVGETFAHDGRTKHPHLDMEVGETCAHEGRTCMLDPTLNHRGYIPNTDIF